MPGRRIILWESFADELLADVKGCEWPIAKAKLISAAFEWCRDTHSYLVHAAPLVTQERLNNYNVLDVARTSVIAVKQALVSGRPLKTQSELQMRQRLAVAPGLNAMPDYAAYFENRLWLHPTPMVTGFPIAVVLAIMPDRDATGLPADMWEQYGNDILNGARKQLFEMPDKPWTSDAGALRYGGDFTLAKAQVATAVDQSFTDAAQRTTSVYF